MATLESRITALELQTGSKVLYSHLIHTYSDNELVNGLGLPHDATDEQLQAVIQGNGAHHGK